MDGMRAALEVGAPAPLKREDVEAGVFAGWSRWATGVDPHEDHVGPFHFRTREGVVECGFLPLARNCNGSGSVHGGALLSFADFSLFMLAGAGTFDFHGVTVGLTAEFVRAAVVDVPIIASGEVVRDGRSLCFVRGLLTQSGSPVLSFSGTLKRLRTG